MSIRYVLADPGLIMEENADHITDMIVELYRTQNVFSHQYDWDPMWETNIRQNERQYQNQDDGRFVILAYEDEQTEPVGMLRCVPYEFGPTVAQKWYLEVTELFIYEAWRGQGIGRGLLEEMREVAERRGFQEISLYVHSENVDAKRFYAIYGFRPMEEIWRLPLPHPQRRFPGPQSSNDPSPSN